MKPKRANTVRPYAQKTGLPFDSPVNLFWETILFRRVSGDFLHFFHFAFHISYERKLCAATHQIVLGVRGFKIGVAV